MNCSNVEDQAANEGGMPLLYVFFERSNHECARPKRRGLLGQRPRQNSDLAVMELEAWTEVLETIPTMRRAKG